MSCSNCSNDVPVITAENEPLESALDNFVTSFYGAVTKTLVNGQVVWTMPCNLDVGLPANPRLPGEGIACYLLRLIDEGIVGLTGPQGLQGETGADGSSPWTLLASAFVQPSVGGNIVVTVQDAEAIPVDSLVFIEGSGWWIVAARNTSAQLIYITLHTQAVVPGTAVQAGGRVLVTGPQGATGAKGAKGDTGVKGDTGAAGAAGADGDSGWTETTANFTVPAVNATVIVSVVSAALFAIGQTVYIDNVGAYQITGRGVGTLTMENLGSTDAVAPGTVVSAATLISPAGEQGPLGTPTHTTLVYNATVNLDFSTAAESHTISLTGDLILTTSNLAAGRRKYVRLIDDSSARALTTPVGWTAVGSAVPANMTAGKKALLELYSFTNADAGVLVKYTEEP
jgi:hypothetical protein